MAWKVLPGDSGSLVGGVELLCETLENFGSYLGLAADDVAVGRSVGEGSFELLRSVDGRWNRVFAVTDWQDRQQGGRCFEFSCLGRLSGLCGVDGSPCQRIGSVERNDDSAITVSPWAM